MSKPSLEELRYEAETEKLRRKDMKRIKVADRPFVEMWDEAKPSHHSRFENLIPQWQRAILKFGTLVKERYESEG